MSYRDRERRKQQCFNTRINREAMRDTDAIINNDMMRVFTGYMHDVFTKTQPESERPPLTLGKMGEMLAVLSMLDMPYVRESPLERMLKPITLWPLPEPGVSFVSPEFLKDYEIGFDPAWGLDYQFIQRRKPNTEAENE